MDNNKSNGNQIPAVLPSGLNDDLLEGLAEPDTPLGGQSLEIPPSVNAEDPGQSIPGTDGNDILFGEDGNDVIDGRRGNDFIDGDLGHDTLYGGFGNDEIYGGYDNDLMYGHDGNDSLDGGEGRDTLNGGNGDDVYFVDEFDVVNEGVSNGIDLVNADINYALGANIENLTLRGFGNINGYGNALDNTINGNTGNNGLFGGDEADTLKGNTGDDHLYGGGGIDSLVGGLGNDLYVIDDSDAVTELAGEGIDAVSSGVNYTLGANLENLRLMGFANVGVGNALNNEIYGNARNDALSGRDGVDTLNGNDGDDSLNGGAGADILLGGNGNDSYLVDASDVVTELVGAGIDTIVTATSYTLGANIENLTLTDAALANGTGNDLNNYMLGNAAGNILNTNGGDDLVNGRDGNDSINGGVGNDTMLGDIGNDFLLGGMNNDVLSGNDGIDTLLGEDGNDILNGGVGNDLLIGGNGLDTLVGGLGADRFKFFSPSEGVDAIGDFNRVEGDKIEIAASFGATSFSQFSYDSATGGLFFDASPSDLISPIRLATLTNKPAGFSPQLDLTIG